MGIETGISWCDHTWSPWRGCAKVSPGCANCYAENLSHRNPAVLGEWGVDGKRVPNKNWKTLHLWNRQAEKDGIRRRVFPSLCDPFEDREDLINLRIKFFEAIHQTPCLDYLILTKRPEAALVWLEGSRLQGLWPLPNVWLGVSVENQEYADERIPLLLQIPAAVRWVSYEPAIGLVDFSEWLYCDRCRHDDEAGQGAYPTPLDNAAGGCWFRECYCSQINWIVVGGESGADRRPFDVKWAEDAARQCMNAKVPFYMKQDAGAKSGLQGSIPDRLWSIKQFPGDKLPRP